MKVNYRYFNYEDDLRAAQNFLYQLYLETNIPQAWYPDRLENDPTLQDGNAIVWETAHDNMNEAEIVAMITLDRINICSFYIKPQYEQLFEEMVQEFEKLVEKNRQENVPIKLNILLAEGYKKREELLANRGYHNLGHFSDIRIRERDKTIPEYQVPKNIRIRSVTDDTDYDKLAEGVRLIFGHRDFTGDTLREMTARTFYRKELDLIAEADNGDIAAFCTYRMDPSTKITQLEPMATHPDYRKLGLAKSIMYEGIKRAEKLGATMFYIGGAAISPAASKLYNSTGFDEVLKENRWIKEI